MGEVREQYVPMRNAWVLCDDCEKWRRIPATLADQIEETNCGWYVIMSATFGFQGVISRIYFLLSVHTQEH